MRDSFGPRASLAWRPKVLVGQGRYVLAKSRTERENEPGPSHSGIVCAGAPFQLITEYMSGASPTRRQARYISAWCISPSYQFQEPAAQKMTPNCMPLARTEFCIETRSEDVPPWFQS